jgi:hypothetical protein
MLARCRRFLLAMTVCGALTTQLPAQTASRSVSTKSASLETYEKGFAWNVMKSPKGRGVCLSDLALLENDGPGSGRSEKGTHVEEVHQGLVLRKQFFLADPRARGATLHLLSPYITERRQQPPFFVLFNGVRLESGPDAKQEPAWHHIHVPAALLRPGTNNVVVGCDQPEGKGLEIMIAREDEYADGGGNLLFFGNTALVAGCQLPAYEEFSGDHPAPFVIGATSGKSSDGGHTWVQGHLGRTDDVNGEYVIRLSLDQFRSSGALASPVIDLWEGMDSLPTIKPRIAVHCLQLAFHGVQPKGTSLLWQVRFSDSRDPCNNHWTAYRAVGEGPSVAQRSDPAGKRFLQWRAILRKSPRNDTPLILWSKVDRVLEYTRQPWGPYYVIAAANHAIRYSSLNFGYERFDEPRLLTLRRRMNLDSVIAGARSDFEKINRIRHAVAQMWKYGSPEPAYPEWDALAILDRAERMGSGGMCQQYAVAFMEALLAVGYQARHANLFAHETIEVFVPDLQKWILADPTESFDLYQYQTTDGLPINCLEQHRYYLEENGYSPSRPIDWMTVPSWRPQDQESTRLPLNYSTLAPQSGKEPPQHRLASFFRITPRNNFLSKPTPRPAMQGRSNWPWNGSVHWYDSSTPRMAQYYLHTDREPDFYPTLGSVQFDCVATDSAGGVLVSMVTFTPNFKNFEVHIDGGDWRESGSTFRWTLRPGAVNDLQMRTANMMNVKGAPSHVRAIWHFCKPGQ